MVPSKSVDMSFAETRRPFNGRCSSGHYVPEPDQPGGSWERGGKGTGVGPIRFFAVTGKGQDDVFCEPCLVIANYVAEQQRKTKGL